MPRSVAPDRSVLVLLSGGVDSSTVCLYLREQGLRVLPHFIFYGQRAADSEWAAARRVARRLHLEAPSSSDLTAFGGALDFVLIRGTTRRARATFTARCQESFLPHRNLLLTTCAAMTAASRGISAIAIGVVGATEGAYGDTTPLFVRQVQAVLRASIEVRVLAPFVKKSKDAVVRFGWDHDFDYGLTFSCHQQSGTHCGRCAGCMARHQALSAYPSPTPTVYAAPVQWA